MKTTTAQQAFTRTDLCVATMVVALLLCLSIPALAKMQPRSQRASCANNLRQFGAALMMYASDNDNCLPVRRFYPAWPTSLLPYYHDLRVLACPSDLPKDFGNYPNYPADTAPRSYIYNGWNDYFIIRFGQSPISRPPTNSLSVSAVPYPAATITMGEKQTQSGHLYMDYEGYDDITQLEQARHGNDSEPTGWSGSNHAFVDGSVRFLRFGAGFSPINQWAVLDTWRNITVPIFTW
jgi:hypothetical protein